MSNVDLIPVENISAWKNALQFCGEFDTYHLPEYHLLAKEMGEGEPYLFFFQEGDRCAALPFLLRPVSHVEGLEDSQLFDVISVYGYPGVVTSVKKDERDVNEFSLGFQSSLRRAFQDLSIATFFGRTNPLIRTSWIFDGLAEMPPLAPTVAIDLSKPETDQIRGMSKGHRYNIRKAREEGVVVEEDRSFQYLDEFIRIYNSTMNRVGSADYYYFPREYYICLKNKLGDSVKLYFARLGENIISASLFFVTGKIIQYHLSGTPSEFLNHHGAKVILDEVRIWGKQNGYSWLHLGGGVGASEDSLFRFKAGFSKLRCSFAVVRIVLNDEVYSELIEKRNKWLRNNGASLMDSNFFPRYRSPFKSSIREERHLESIPRL